MSFDVPKDFEAVACWALGYRGDPETLNERQKQMELSKRKRKALTEIVFSRPGLGKLLVGALSQRDYTMLQGMMVIYTLAVVVVNLLSDLAYGFVDPRVKLA